MTSNLVTQVKHTREVIVLEDQAANDGELTDADLQNIDLAVHEAKKSYGWMRRSLEDSAQQKEDDRYLRELRTRGLL